MSEPNPSDDVVFARVQQRYERARVVHAVQMAWPSVLASLVATALGASWAVCAVVVVAHVGLRVWSTTLGRAASFGIAWGMPALLAPALVMKSGMCSMTSCGPACAIACLLAGASAGTAMGLRARDEGLAFFAAAALACAVLGALGCTAMGMGSVLGVVAGTVVSAAPWLLWRPARA